MATDVPAPVRRLWDAANANDTEAFLSAFTADGPSHFTFAVEGERVARMTIRA